MNNPVKKRIPCVMHVGEGTDQFSHREIDTITRWNILNREIIAVHGIAMDPKQVKHFKGLIWCPASNYFLFNKTAGIDKLKKFTTICFGTDSTLTSAWNAWDHFRLALETGLSSPEELFGMLTENPAKLWHIDRGSISPGKSADIVIAKARDKQAGLKILFDTDPGDILMVIQNGEIRLFDIALEDQLTSSGLLLSAYTLVRIYGEEKYVMGDLRKLVNEVKKCNTSADIFIEIVG